MVAICPGDFSYTRELPMVYTCLDGGIDRTSKYATQGHSYYVRAAFYL